MGFMGAVLSLMWDSKESAGTETNETQGGWIRRTYRGVSLGRGGGRARGGSADGRGRRKVWVRWRKARRREAPRRVENRCGTDEVPRRSPRASQKKLQSLRTWVRVYWDPQCGHAVVSPAVGRKCSE